MGFWLIFGSPDKDCSGKLANAGLEGLVSPKMLRAESAATPANLSRAKSAKLPAEMMSPLI
jgi:hypothetical protein